MALVVQKFGGSSVADVARRLEVNLAQVYLVKHRLSRLLREELERLRAGR